MKPTSSWLKSFKATAVGIFATAVVLGLSVSSGQAGFILSLQEVGSNVVASGNGTLDLSGLTLLGPGGLSDFVFPSLGAIGTGQPGPGDRYTGFSGPSSFGSGGFTTTTGGTGDIAFINGSSNLLLVPQFYVSGSSLSNISTYSGQTFGSLGLASGTYVWTWGIGAHQDSFTLQIGQAVPDSGSSIALLFGSFATLLYVSRRFRQPLFG